MKSGYFSDYVSSDIIRFYFKTHIAHNAKLRVLLCKNSPSKALKNNILTRPLSQAIITEIGRRFHILFARNNRSVKQFARFLSDLYTTAIDYSMTIRLSDKIFRHRWPIKTGIWQLWIIECSNAAFMLLELFG